MIIERIINNNVVSALDEDGKEIVVMGNGIGFGKKKGQTCDENRIEKVFHMEDERVLSQFKDLLAKLPLEYIQVSYDIISYAKQELGVKLNQNVYITLTDHISFALERLSDGMTFTNALHSEIRRFYPTEYSVGIHALHLIKEKTGISLPEDEAASIALHLVNAELNLQMRDIWVLTNMIGKMMDVIVQYLPILKEESHEGLYRYLQSNCPELMEGVESIAGMLQEEYGCHMTEEEQLYLGVSLKRIKDLFSEM